MKETKGVSNEIKLKPPRVWESVRGWVALQGPHPLSQNLTLYFIFFYILKYESSSLISCHSLFTNSNIIYTNRWELTLNSQNSHFMLESWYNVYTLLCIYTYWIFMFLDYVCYNIILSIFDKNVLERIRMNKGIRISPCLLNWQKRFSLWIERNILLANRSLHKGSMPLNQPIEKDS